MHWFSGLMLNTGHIVGDGPGPFCDCWFTKHPVTDLLKRWGYHRLSYFDLGAWCITAAHSIWACPTNPLIDPNLHSPRTHQRKETHWVIAGRLVLRPLRLPEGSRRHPMYMYIYIYICIHVYIYILYMEIAILGALRVLFFRTKDWCMCFGCPQFLDKARYCSCFSTAKAATYQAPLGSDFQPQW